MKRTLLAAIAIGLLSGSCSTTANLPEEETLYTGIKSITYGHKINRKENKKKGEEGVITSIADAYRAVDELLTGHGAAAMQGLTEKQEAGSLTKEQRDSVKAEAELIKEAYGTMTDEVDAALAYKPNNALFGSSSMRIPFPVGLWTYNSFVNSKNKFGKWIFNTFASTPVTISMVNPKTRALVAQNTLRNYGFFRGTVSYEILPQKKARQAKVSYTVMPNALFRLDSIAYMAFPDYADSLVRRSMPQSLLHRGDAFNVVNLDGERTRLSTLFRNNGFYYFRPEYITYRADTVQTPQRVQLQVIPAPGVPSNVRNRYFFGRTTIELRDSKGGAPTDTVVLRDYTFIYKGKNHRSPLRFGTLRGNLFYKKGDLYRQRLHELMVERLNGMGMFSQANIKYVPRDTTPDNTTLDVLVSATLDKPYDGEFETKITSKSNGQVGPGLSFGLSKRNAFRGAERLKFEVHGSYEWQTGATVEGRGSAINSYEYGASLSLDYPRLLLPGAKRVSMRSRSTTSFMLDANWLNRAGYFNMVSLGARVAYTYQARPTVKHEFVPFRLDYDELLHTTADFDSIMRFNQALYVSMRDQFVPSMRYTFTYSSRRRARNPRSFMLEVKEAGNITSGIFAACGKPFGERDKHILGVPFAQFVKVTAEFRESFRLTPRQSIAARIGGGVVYSYGNSTSAPYNDLFSVGGANSIRAFTLRGVGPGSYHPGTSAYSYIDQMGDIKLEANVEYRFPVISSLYGAVFLDAGNVWLMKSDKARPGGELRLSSFARDLALGTGIGLRYDLDFLVLRFDVGVGLHAPFDTGRSGYYNMPKFGDSLGFHLAVGYPF
ncbi:MAG: BamA/TamA family outer membrane protein [Clostridium sp.]|nr:BamA/TamA family outer membrane protein [Clostridium sp.]